MSKKRILSFSVAACFLFAMLALKVNAQNQFSVDYAGQPVIDSDLDGLTDEGELKIFKTDPNNPDTDGDGYLDGAEVLSGTGPLDPNSNVGTLQLSKTQNANMQVAKTETPWPWYVARASGLVGFVLLYISIFLALTLRIRFMHKLFAPLYALNAHGWIALQATIIALAHGLVLTLDKFLNFSLVAVLVPFASKYEPILVGLGTLGFYLMLILTVTSYVRNHLPHGLWRAIHFLNIGLYFMVIAHAMFLGTDLKNEMARNIFILANGFLILLMFVNMFLRIKDSLERKRMLQNQTESESYPRQENNVAVQ